MNLAESDVESAALEWFSQLGWTVLPAARIAPGEIDAERDNFHEVVCKRRLTDALARLNPQIPVNALDEARRKVLTPDSPSLLVNNRAFHRMLVDGAPVEYNRKDGSIAGDHAVLFDFENPDNNDWLAVNQYVVIEGQQTRRFDIVLFVNGLPLAAFELKNAAAENATIWEAFNQFKTYKAQLPAFFIYNELLVISDGLTARLGTLTADKERFMPWRTIQGESVAPNSMLELEVLIEGVFEKQRLLDLLRCFVVYEDDGSGNVVKKIAGYHQFHAVNIAVAETLRACAAIAESVSEEQGNYYAKKRSGGESGDQRVGVIWHTQGSGKSLTMAFFTGRIVLHPAMQNPTVVVLTDRNDLDDQLFGTFSRCQDLLRQTPMQATSREHIRELLKVASGGIVFTTIQKFMPEEKGDRFPMLSDRRNIVVIADEAHRSQYDFIDGFAKNMRDALPNASFIGFTGTPIEATDKNTRAVFGDYISIYDIERAVKDGATVPIYYEGRLAKLQLDEKLKPKIDPEFDDATEDQEDTLKEKLKSKWAALEAIVGAEKRVEVIAKDLVDHFEKRLEAMDGKAMVVCMSRRICVELYNALVKLRPQWHDDSDDGGAIKIVMTGSATDKIEMQPHIRNKPRREALAKRFKNPKDSFKIVIVRDMWLTGFDAPCLHTMYIDKPMRGHGLMQAIARVNRVFKDKPGGLVVDYLGLADQLKRALQDYTESEGKGRPTIDKDEAVVALLNKFGACADFFSDFDYSNWKTGTPGQKLGLLPGAQEHILKKDDGKANFLRAVADLTKAFALATPHEEAIKRQEDVGFFQAVRTALAKSDSTREHQSLDEVDHAVRQIVSRAVSSDEVIDIFAAAGLKKPNISILSDEFLADVRGMPQRNLAVELLRKLLQGEIKTRSKRNLVQARSFSEMLENAVRGYHNRAIETAQIIEELIALAKDMRVADKRGEKLGLSLDEAAFYDALEVNDSAVKVLGDDNLRMIARELVETVRKNTSIDWTVKESVRAKLRVLVKRILRKYGYPPDKQEKATQTVMDQAELLCEGWVA